MGLLSTSIPNDELGGKAVTLGESYGCEEATEGDGAD